MQSLKDIKIGRRLNLFMSLAFVVVVAALGLYTMNMQKTQIIENTDTRMTEQVNDLAHYIDIQVRKNQKNVNRFLDVAHQMFYQQGDLRVDEEATVQMEASNQISGSTHRVNLPKWYHGEREMHEDFSFVDQIMDLTGATATIFQKIDNGYLRISTNVEKENGSRAVGTYIPNSSPVIQTIENGQTYRGRAYVVNGWYLTAYEPIRIDGEIRGILYVGVKEKDMGDLKDLFYSKTYYESGYPYLVDEQGKVLVHPDSETEGISIENEDFFQQMANDPDGEGKIDYMWEGRKKLQYFKYVEPVKSFVTTTLYEDKLMGMINRTRNAILVAILLGIGFFVLINTQISRSITNGLKRGVRFAQRIAEGDLTTTLDIRQKDEIGDMADAMNRMVYKLRSIVGDVQSGSDNISSASQQVSSSSQELSQGSSEQASSVEEVSSSMEEMASNIQQNTDNSSQTEKIATSAAKDMEKMGEAGKKSLSSIREIADKITIINDIAFQTNILALNAAVEAARAGEYGKGFAVVAAEVRKLAERSKNAADEIVELADSSVEVTEESSKLLEDLLPQIEKTSKLVQEINAASMEQNSGTDQINNAVQQLNQVTQQNAASSEELATSAEEMASQADQLRNTIAYFKTGQEQSQAANKHGWSAQSEGNGGMHSASQDDAEWQKFQNKAKQTASQPPGQEGTEGRTQPASGFNIDMKQEDQ